MSTGKEIFVCGKKALRVADALNTANVKIIKLTLKEPLSISMLAKRLAVSESYISDSVRVLEELQLVNITYERGGRGIRKVVSTNLEKIVISLVDEDEQPSNM